MTSEETSAKLNVGTDLLLERLAERDRIIYELNRKLRNFDELQRQLDSRTERLAQKEEEVAALVRELMDRNALLAESEINIRRLSDALERSERQIKHLNSELKRLRARQQ
jgi:hypothetical protein